jgi:hypothetical protein
MMHPLKFPGTNMRDELGKDFSAACGKLRHALQQKTGGVLIHCTNCGSYGNIRRRHSSPSGTCDVVNVLEDWEITLAK